MTQTIRITDFQGEELVMTFPNRYLQNLIPTLTAFANAVSRQRGWSIRFEPPISVENESNPNEHFWLGTPPLTALLPPIMLFSFGIALMEVDEN